MKVGRKHGIHQITKYNVTILVLCIIILLCHYILSYYYLYNNNVLLFNNLNNGSVVKSYARALLLKSGVEQERLLCCLRIRIGREILDN